MANASFSPLPVTYKQRLTFTAEEASTGRAGCKNTECAKEKVKILKGELRFGTWIEGEQFQSWAWKHWCVVVSIVYATSSHFPLFKASLC